MWLIVTTLLVVITQNIMQNSYVLLFVPFLIFNHLFNIMLEITLNYDKYKGRYLFLIK